MFTRIFSAIPFILLNLRAPDGTEGGGGEGGEKQDPPIPAEEPKPEGDTIEARLQSATSWIGKLFKSAAKLASDLATANGERARLQGQFNDATKGWNDEKDAHKTTRDQLATANTTITGLTTERDTAQANVSRLESLCQLRGIDPKAAVPPTTTPVGDSTPSGKWDKYQELKKSDPTAAHAYWRENKAELEKFAAAKRKPL